MIRLRKFVVLFLSFFTCAIAHGQYSFDGPREITSMYYQIKEIETADLDGNGLRDIVISTYSLYTRVVVKFQVSPGEFSDSLVFRNLPGFTGLSLNDVENDGDVDILMHTNESNSTPLASNSLVILPNNGDGSFATPVISHFDDYFGVIRYFDWDMDGLLDVLVESNDIIYLHMQTASLVLEQGQTIYQTPGLSTFNITDLDNDGDWDLVGVYYDNAVNLRKHFYALQSTPFNYESLVVIEETSNALRDSEFVDFNNDGFIDYIMTCTNGTGLFVFLNDGLGNLIYSTGSSGIWDGIIDIVDLDGNGYLDISAFELDGDEITFGYNDGSSITWQVLETNILSSGGLTVDMDGDGDLDFCYVYALGGLQDLHYGLNPGDYTQVAWTQLIESYYPAYQGATVIDYNNDDKIDLVVNMNGTGVVIENNGDGSFDELLTLPGTFSYVGSKLKVVDLNNDGLDDMICVKENVNSTNDNIKTLIRSDVSFYYSEEWELESYHIWRYAVSDFNGDNFPDLVFQEFPNYKIRYCLNQGDGSFGSAYTLVDLDGNADLTFINADADGFPDLIVDESGQAKVYINNTTGGFSSGPIFTSTTERMLEGTDWDNDGLEDIFSVDGNLYWRKNLGGLVYADRAALTVGLGAGDFKYTDMNTDGFMDIVLSRQSGNPDSSSIYILNNNSGTNLTVFPIAKIPGSNGIVYTGDMDTDGLADLVFYDYEYREFYWWKNLGDSCDNFQPEIGGDQVFCPGESITFEVAGADQYNWEYDYYGSNYQITPDSTEVYRVYVSSDIGCRDTLSVTAIVAEILDVQVLLNGPTLSASGGNDIQWYEVGNPEVLSNASSFNPAVNGFYFFTSLSPDGCAQQSDTLEFLYYGIDEKHRFSITLFPNPGADVLNIGYAEPSAIDNIFISDMQGRRIWTAESIHASGSYVLPRTIAPASYVVHINYNDGTSVKKIWMRE